MKSNSFFVYVKSCGTHWGYGLWGYGLWRSDEFSWINVGFNNKESAVLDAQEKGYKVHP